MEHLSPGPTPPREMPEPWRWRQLCGKPDPTCPQLFCLQGDAADNQHFCRGSSELLPSKDLAPSRHKISVCSLMLCAPSNPTSTLLLEGQGTSPAPQWHPVLSFHGGSQSAWGPSSSLKQWSALRHSYQTNCIKQSGILCSLQHLAQHLSAVLLPPWRRGTAHALWGSVTASVLALPRKAQTAELTRTEKRTGGGGAGDCGQHARRWQVAGTGHHTFTRHEMLPRSSGILDAFSVRNGSC